MDLSSTDVCVESTLHKGHLHDQPRHPFCCHKKTYSGNRNPSGWRRISYSSLFQRCVFPWLCYIIHPTHHTPGQIHLHCAPLYHCFRFFSSTQDMNVLLYCCVLLYSFLSRRIYSCSAQNRCVRSSVVVRCCHRFISHSRREHGYQPVRTWWVVGRMTRAVIHSQTWKDGLIVGANCLQQRFQQRFVGTCEPVLFF